MAPRRDLISVVEAAYDLKASQHDWCQGLCDAVYEVIQPEGGMTTHHVDIGPDGMRFAEGIVDTHTPWGLAEKLRTLGEILDAKYSKTATESEIEQARIYERLIRMALDEPADLMTHTEFTPAGPEWMYTMNLPIEDTFVLRNHHIDGNGVTLMVGALRKRRSFGPAERAMFQRLSAHIKAGFRLRRRLTELSASVDVPEGGAVLDGAGHLLHAEGQAQARDAATDLEELAKRIDRARCQKTGRSEEALAAWHGLVQGEWSLIDTVDTDGKRYMLAHRNPEEVNDPRGLTSMESRVVGLAVRGYSDSLISYHLGVAEGTVSSHLSRAMQKLKFASRVELVRYLGRRYPQDPM